MARMEYNSASQFWVQGYEDKHAQSYEQHYVDPTGTIISQQYPSARAVTYDSSPPSSTDVPALSRSGTTDTVSSSASSYISSISRSGTPASSIGSYADENENFYEGLPLTGPYHQYAASPRHVQRDVVHVHIANQHMGSSGGKHAMLPYEIERVEEEAMQKPAKKARTTAANIFSRFLGGGVQAAKECQYA